MYPGNIDDCGRLYYIMRINVHYNYYLGVKMKVSVISADISEVAVDGLITVVDSDGDWSGSIDFLIKESVDSSFHSKLEYLQLTEGVAYFIPGDESNKAAYRDVIFVIDDWHHKLYELILTGLNEAERNQLSSVSLPTIKLVERKGMINRSEDELLEEIVLAIRLFRDSNPTFVKRVTFAVYQNSDIELRLYRMIKEDESHDYNVVFEYAKDQGGYAGNRTWTSFSSQEDFEDWYDDEMKSVNFVVEAGVSRQRCLELVRQVPEHCIVNAAIDNIARSLSDDDEANAMFAHAELMHAALAIAFRAEEIAAEKAAAEEN